MDVKLCGRRAINSGGNWMIYLFTSLGSSSSSSTLGRLFYFCAKRGLIRSAFPGRIGGEEDRRIVWQAVIKLRAFRIAEPLIHGNYIANIFLFYI